MGSVTYRTLENNKKIHLLQDGEGSYSLVLRPNTVLRPSPRVLNTNPVPGTLTPSQISVST